MDLLVTLDFRFVRTPDGQVWTRTAYSYAFWDRYLKVFDHVKIVARAEAKPSVDEQYKQVNGPGVTFLGVPFYLGPWQYLKAHRRVRQAVRSSVSGEEAVLCRVASQLASDLLPALWAENRPYGLEVVGDPYEAFSPGAVKHPLRPYFRRRTSRLLKEQCARAAAVSYVTEQSLQRRYPCGNNLAVAVSDADLQAASFSATSRVFTSGECAATPKTSSGAARPRLVFVGSLEQMYKGPDVLLRAMALLQSRVPVQLRIVGAGRYRSELEQLARSLSLDDTVEFTGELAAGAAIRSELDNATLMVLPSRTEGLPRVVIEGMARGLPCVATNVGGIPELLDAEDLVRPNDPRALAEKIEKVVGDSARLSRMSARNLAKAQDFRPEVLESKRTSFYRFLRDTTNTWLTTRKREGVRVA